MNESLYEHIKEVNINLLIEKHISFIIKVVSSITGRYVYVKNDDEFSIALIAFEEAVDKYDKDKGEFLSFAKLVISSRVKNYLLKENKVREDYIEDLKNKGIEIDNICTSPIESENELIREIDNLTRYINDFGFSFDDLVNEAPKHKDTRENAINIAEKINDENDIKKAMYEKRRLPITQIIKRFSVTEKTVKRSKKFIISVVIILDNKLRNLKSWLGR